MILVIMVLVAGIQWIKWISVPGESLTMVRRGSLVCICVGEEERSRLVVILTCGCVDGVILVFSRPSSHFPRPSTDNLYEGTL